MDPNFPYNNNIDNSSSSNLNSNLSQGYFYDHNSSFPQSQYPFMSAPQHPPQPQVHPQAPSYYQPSYPQSLPQNYPQYHHHQQYNQSYQPPFQQFQQPLNQPPAQLQPQQLAQPEPAPFEIVIPRPSIHSSSAQPLPDQRSPEASHQPQSQVRKPYPSHQNTPNHYQQSQHVPQPPQQNLSQRSQPSVVSDLQSSSSAPPSQSKKKERQVASASASNTPNMTRQSQSRVLQAVEINATLKQPVTKTPDHRDSAALPDEPEPDYPSLLCVLADDYHEAARKLPALTEEYYTLISTALGCLESALANFKLPPLREAHVSLRYAQILYAETENYDEAETTLTKAIELCERHKFVDLKYEMQLLLSRVLYESKPKAALRDIQRMIEDIEAYRHTVWIYVFRFQHAMFSLASSAPGEVHGAVVQLEKITTLARQNSDSAILAFAATLESLLHLSTQSHDAVTASQTALAKARALQLSPDVEGNPQLTILMEFIDLACSVREADISQTETKRKIMQEVLFQAVGHPNWRDDGLIYIPVATKAVAGMQLHGNGYVIERNGKYHIPFSWLGKEEAEALGFLFSAESSAYKNGADGGKAEKFVDSGLSVLRALGMPSLKAGYRESKRQFNSQRLAEAEFLLLLVFLQCSKGLWQAANESLDKLHAISQDMGDDFPVNLKYCLLYLRGVILQGTGDLTAALRVYQSPLFNIGTQHNSPSTGPGTSRQISNSYHAESDITRNFSILAAMNSAMIIRNPAHPQHNRLSSLIKTLNSAVQNCTNRYIKAHFALLESILSTNTLAEKQYLKRSMDEGRAIGSAQTTALALIYMQDQLYKGMVDEQALKCAKASSFQTKRWGQPMWMHVAAGLEAQALDIHGFPKEAQKKKDEAEAGWQRLPKGIKGIQDDGLGMSDQQ
ncbi:uncharacterized protein Z520_10564 [Fonsecaea multimorphosa CBS 102226]|uniref:Cohesin loading factor n=1 Tax=Fonsecaea multimorphosa CBS 102226 TaxID=1442371 RepID=A0A0D2KAU8_9EURO|nr:uncharacterized protein Z520_10564 [Fonsecaea multimorphosa CBS 102226]KIX93658.1 hypothetical protein Z520_10564 [Fonsecaea multimorphosa CBS 102226]OAL19771.1 hypothetical protein AYO22_09298 [Fonsecaea multimorphosa]